MTEGLHIAFRYFIERHPEAAEYRTLQERRRPKFVLRLYRVLQDTLRAA